MKHLAKRRKKQLSRRTNGRVVLSRRKDKLRKSKGLKKRVAKHDSSKKKSPEQVRRERSERWHKNCDKHQWKPGQSGNPKGREPKEISITSLVKKMLGEIVEGTDGKTHADQVSEALVGGLKILDRTAIKEMLARIEGPVKQKIEIERPEPFTVTFVDDDDDATS